MVEAFASGQVHSQMKVLITGAGGMLGSDLAFRLALRHEVVGAGRNPAPHLEIPFEVVNLEKAELIQALFEKVRPEVVLHAAAITDVDGCETNRRQALLGNFETTRHLTEAGNRREVLIIFFSTDFVFDGRKSGPYEEEDEARPLSFYGETKLLAERYLSLRAKRFLIIRTSWLFGKHGENFPQKILSQAEEGKSIRVVSDQTGSPTYTADLAEGMDALLAVLLTKGRALENQIYHLANEGAVSRYEFAKAVLKIKNYPPHLLVPISSEEIVRPAARPKNSVLSTEKAKRMLGIQLRPWEEALKSFLEGGLNLPCSNITAGN